MNKKIITGGLVPFLLTACVGGTPNIEQYKQEFRAGDYAKASETILPSSMDINKEKIGSSSMVRGLESGISSLYAVNSEKSIKSLDLSESALQDSGTFSSSYEPKYYEEVMLNTYKAVAYLSKNDKDNARVEFNRAYTKQDKAKEENKKRISKAQKKADKKTLSSVTGKLDKEYNVFDNFKPYADFVNPYVTYVSGLYLTFEDSKSDKANGINFLKRANSMVENPVISGDIELAENNQTGSNVWVFFENGLLPEIEKETIQIPFPTKSGIKMANMNLPKFKSLPNAYEYIIVKSEEQEAETKEVVDMERVMKGDFQANYPAEVATAVVWMAVNLVAQEAAAQGASHLTGKLGGSKLGKFGAGSAAGLAVSQISNPIETRTWSSLPKNIQVARIAKPKNNTLDILNNKGNKIADVKLSDDIKNAFVFVRVPSAGAKPSVIINKLN